MASFTCKGCDNRHPGCHSHCEKYLAEKAAWDEMMAAERHRRIIAQGLTEQRTRAVYKTELHKINKRGGQQ